jgi:hypothetical protein
MIILVVNVLMIVKKDVIGIIISKKKKDLSGLCPQNGD